MNKRNIIKSALEILKSELQHKGELTVCLAIVDLVDSASEFELAGEFSGLQADEYDEAFYYNITDDKYYYYGEAFADNPGSFSNRYGFLIEEDDLELLPESFKHILRQVAKTKEHITIRINALN